MFNYQHRLIIFAEISTVTVAESSAFPGEIDLLYIQIQSDIKLCKLPF